MYPLDYRLIDGYIVNRVSSGGTVLDSQCSPDLLTLTPTTAHAHPAHMPRERWGWYKVDVPPISYCTCISLAVCADWMATTL